MRSFKGWWVRGASEAWFSVRDPEHLQLLDTLVEGSEVYLTGTLLATKSKTGTTSYATVRVDQLEKV